MPADTQWTPRARVSSAAATDGVHTRLVGLLHGGVEVLVSPMPPRSSTLGSRGRLVEAASRARCLKRRPLLCTRAPDIDSWGQKTSCSCAACTYKLDLLVHAVLE